MKQFQVVVSEEAKSDIDNLFDFIVTEYKSELTFNHFGNINETTKTEIRRTEPYNC
mgnify:CR=1 FL=1